jgi:hypothetical protein
MAIPIGQRDEDIERVPAAAEGNRLVLAPSRRSGIGPFYPTSL